MPQEKINPVIRITPIVITLFSINYLNFALWKVALRMIESLILVTM